jgi:O-antigen ligase
MSLRLAHRKARRAVAAQSSTLEVSSSPPKERASDYHATVYFLFLFFAFYLTLPIIDIPLLGLSFSAPVFFLVAMPVFLRSPRPWVSLYRNWIMLAAAIWLGIFFSAMFAGLLSGGARIDQRGWLSLVRFAYWILIFVVTIYLVSSQPGLGARLTVTMSIGITILGLLRLGEAVFGGAIGAWTRLQLISQNSYGIQFSMFFPLLLSLLYWKNRRYLSIFAVFVVLGAIFINGSRSNWIAILVAVSIFFWILLRNHSQRLRSAVILFVLAILLSLGAVLAPVVLPDVVGAFEQRLGTFDRLEEDKSYLIRQLMVQKGLGLFQENPLFGVGISRWNRESTPLELPRILSYASQEHFDIKSSHNSYISFLAETGLAGSVPFALLLLILFFAGYRAVGHLVRYGHIWAAGVYAGFIGMSIHLWTLSGLTGTAPWFIYGMVAGLIVLERQIAKQASQDSNAPRILLPHSRRF